MKKENGFTLIELIAVIVIIALVALFTIPMVIDTIFKAKVKSAEDAAYGIRKEAQILQKNAMMNSGGTFSYIEIDFENLDADGQPITNLYKTLSSVPDTNTVKFKVSGRLPSSGKLIIYGGGNMEFKDIVIDNYDCIIPETGDITCDKENNSSYVYYNNSDSHDIKYIGDSIDIDNLTTGYTTDLDTAIANHIIYLRHTVKNNKITKTELCINKSNWGGELCIDVEDNNESNETKLLKHFGYNNTTKQTAYTGVSCYRSSFTSCGNASISSGITVRIENNVKSAYIQDLDDNKFTCRMNYNTIGTNDKYFFSWCTNE